MNKTYSISEIVEASNNILNRPLLYDTNKKGQLEDMLKNRQDFYHEASEIVVDITGLSIQDAVKEVYSKVQCARS